MQGHSRLTAYAAVRLGDADLAARALDGVLHRDGYTRPCPGRRSRSGHHAESRRRGDWVSTNTTALYGLAAIQNLALIGDRITNP